MKDVIERVSNVAAGRVWKRAGQKLIEHHAQRVDVSKGSGEVEQCAQKRATAQKVIKVCLTPFVTPFGGLREKTPDPIKFLWQVESIRFSGILGP